MRISFGKATTLITIATLWLSPLKADTFQVTSSKCSGPGGLYEAIQLANATPGEDIVELAGGLTITDCPKPPKPDDASLQITESLTLMGNSSLLHGSNLYLSSQGQVNEFDTGWVCPISAASKYNLVGESPTAFMIGQRNIDNAGIEVIIENFQVDSVSQLANVRDGAKLTLRDVTAREIYDIRFCGRPAIAAVGNADLTLERVKMVKMTSFNRTLGTGMIEGKAGKLEVYDSVFDFSNGRHAISWGHGGIADIVSSRFTEAGGLLAGGGTFRVINSLFLPRDSSPELFGNDGFLVNGGGSISLEASTVVYHINECKLGLGGNCLLDSTITSWPTFQVLDGGISFKESVLHVTSLNPNDSPSLTPLLGASPDGFFFADENSFIQPLEWQKAAALKTITSQPDLLTGSDALPVSNILLGFLVTSFPDNVTPVITGDAILVDKIPDADPGGANALKDSRGNTIANDILGNPRTDFSGMRSIGAVQNNAVPFLVAQIDAVDPNTADLAWTNPTSAGVTAYDICYGTATAPDIGAIGTTCPGTLLTDFTTCATCLYGEVSGLPDAAQVWFLVRAKAGATLEPWSRPATVKTPVILTYPPTSFEAGQPLVIYPVITGTLTNPVFTIISGQLPPGLTLDPNTGIISGTPTSGGAFSVGILVTDSTGASSTPSSSSTVLVLYQTRGVPLADSVMLVLILLLGGMAARKIRRISRQHIR